MMSAVANPILYGLFNQVEQYFQKLITTIKSLLSLIYGRIVHFSRHWQRQENNGSRNLQITKET